MVLRTFFRWTGRRARSSPFHASGILRQLARCPFSNRLSNLRQRSTLCFQSRRLRPLPPGPEAVGGFCVRAVWGSPGFELSRRLRGSAVWIVSPADVSLRLGAKLRSLLESAASLYIAHEIQAPCSLGRVARKTSGSTLAARSSRASGVHAASHPGSTTPFTAARTRL